MVGLNTASDLSGGDAAVRTRYWHRTDDGRTQCDVCPRHCRLHEGQRGLCFVRACRGGEIVLTTYGRSSGFVVDPIEKKPLNHFLPGTPVLSFGTAGCNLRVGSARTGTSASRARWRRSPNRLHPRPWPTRPCRSGAERCLHVQRSGHLPGVRDRRRQGVPRARRPDRGGDGRLHRCRAEGGILRAHGRRERRSQGVYRATSITRLRGAPRAGARDARVPEARTRVWFEITNLMIPGLNDSEEETRRDDAMDRRASRTGRAGALHRVSSGLEDAAIGRRRLPTTLRRARGIALRNGVRYAYTGNVHDVEGGTT